MATYSFPRLPPQYLGDTCQRNEPVAPSRLATAAAAGVAAGVVAGVAAGVVAGVTEGVVEGVVEAAMVVGTASVYLVLAGVSDNDGRVQLRRKRRRPKHCGGQRRRRHDVREDEFRIQCSSIIFYRLCLSFIHFLLPYIQPICILAIHVYTTYMYTRYTCIQPINIPALCMYIQPNIHL